MELHEADKAFDHATIPDKKDLHWKTWHQDENGKYSFNEESTLDWQKELRFTYMQTFVEVPDDYDLKKFEVSFEHVDDGARIYVFNTHNPTGATVLENIFGNNVNSADLKKWIRKGVKNRVVVVQYDWAKVINSLTNLHIKINGSTVEPPRLGTLRLVSQSASGGGGKTPDGVLNDKPSVSLILDASGSMTYKMKSEPTKTRWTVAKRSSTKL